MIMDEKICPLMTFRSAQEVRCLIEKCAWYDFMKEQCCLQTLSFQLEKVHDALETLAIKI